MLIDKEPTLFWDQDADLKFPDHHVNGRPQDYDAVPVAANATGGSLGNCASTAGAIHYYERAAGSEA